MPRVAASRAQPCAGAGERLVLSPAGREGEPERSGEPAALHKSRRALAERTALLRLHYYSCINTRYRWGHESNSPAGSAGTGAAISSACTMAVLPRALSFPCPPGLRGPELRDLGAPSSGILGPHALEIWCNEFPPVLSPAPQQGKEQSPRPLSLCPL